MHGERVGRGYKKILQIDTIILKEQIMRMKSKLEDISYHTLSRNFCQVNHQYIENFWIPIMLVKNVGKITILRMSKYVAIMKLKVEF